MRREFVRVSPVVNAAEKSSVASIRPMTIKAVCALRRGKFLTAILKEVWSLAASTVRIRELAAKTRRRPHVSCCVGTPNNSSILPTPAGRLVAFDTSVAHPHYAVCATGNSGVVRDEDKRLASLPVEHYQ